MANHAELLSEHGSWDKVIEALELELATAPDDAARSAALATIAVIQVDELQQTEQAINTLEQLAELAFDDHPSMDRLAELYRTAQRWDDLVALQIDRTDVAPDAFARALLLLDAASVSATGKQDSAAASLLLKQVLLTTDSSPELLAEIEQRTSSWPSSDAWIDVLLDRIAELTDAVDLTGAAPLHDLLARTLRAAGRLERARAHMEQALAATPDDDTRTELLLDLLVEVDDIEAQSETLERLRARVEHAVATPGAALLTRAAELARTIQPSDITLVRTLITHALTTEWNETRFGFAWTCATESKQPDWLQELAIDRLSRSTEDAEHAAWGLKAADAAASASDVESVRSILTDLHARHPNHEEVMSKLLPLLDPAEHRTAREQLLGRMLDVDAFAEHETPWRLELAGLLEAHDLASAYTTLLPLAGEDPVLLGRLAVMARALDRTEESMRWLAAQASHSDDALTPLVELATLREGEPEEIDAWNDVLALRPEHRQALSRLHSVLRDSSQWSQLASVVETLAGLSTDPDERSQLLVELADLHRLHLHNPERALDLYEEALVLAPASAPAAEPLLERAIAAADWARIPRLIDIVLAAPGVGDDPDLSLPLLVHKAAALEELAREHDAVDAWRQVLGIDPHHFEAHRCLATLLLDLQLPGEAAPHFDHVLATDLSEEPASDRVALLYQAGMCSVLIGDFDGAAVRFTNALLLEPYHLPTLNALANQPGFGPSDLRIQAHERLLLTTTEPLVQFRLLVSLGDLCVAGEHLDDAISAYKRAVDIDGTSRVVLHKLLQLFSNREQWQLAAEVLGKLASLETDTARQKKLLLTVAALQRDQLGDAIAAAAVYNRILDAHPSDLDTFQELDSMLVEKHEYLELEHAYRRMLERAGTADGTETLRFTLFRNLGRIHANFLNDRMQAAASFDLALRLMPDHEATWSEWIALYPTDGSADDTLTDIHLRAITNAPTLLDSYHALFDIASHRRLFDRALRLAAALDVMGQATQEEADFYTQLQPRTLPLASTPISHAQWRLLHHPDLDPRICLLVQTLSQTVASTLATGLDRWGVSRRNAVNLQQSHPITNLFVYSSQVLSVDLPELIVSPGLSGLHNAHASPRAIIVGQDIHSGEANRRMVFRISHAMTLMRPEFYLASAYGSRDWLKALIYGALATVTGTLIPDPSEEQVMMCFRAIERQSQPVLDQIAQSVSGLFADDANPDVTAWFHAMDYTAGRVGLLLCGDLSRALQAVQDTPESFSGLSVAARCSDLVQFSLSPAYEQVRAELRLGVGQQ